MAGEILPPAITKIAARSVLIAFQILWRNIILWALVYAYLANIRVRCVFHAGHGVRLKSLALFDQLFHTFGIRAGNFG
jgi:hypothetical protein